MGCPVFLLILCLAVCSIDGLAAFLAPRPRSFYRFSKSLEVIFFYWSFCHNYSPSYIVLFLFSLGYVYIVHSISLNKT